MYDSVGGLGRNKPLPAACGSAMRSADTNALQESIKDARKDW